MLIDKLKESAAYVREKVGNDPIFLALVLGSGLGDLADEFEDKIIIPYAEIPHFPQATVSGHAEF